MKKGMAIALALLLGTVSVQAISAEPVKKALPGDMLVNGDTEHTAPYGVLQGDTVKLTGMINTMPIREQMKKVEEQFARLSSYFSFIPVTVGELQFRAVLTLPDGLSFVNKDVTLEQFGDYDQINSVLDGNKLTVTITTSKKIKNYQQLHDFVLKAGGTDGWMKVTATGVKVGDTAPGTLLTAQGVLTGTMKATATNLLSGTTKTFNFEWKAEQTDEGRDAIAAPGSKNIQLTVKAEYDRIKVTFSGTKKAVNHRLKGGEYAFTIKDGSGKIRQTVSNDEQGRIVFSPRTFSRTGTFTYTIEEVPGNRAHMVYDKTVYTAKVTTTAVGGALQAKVELERDGVPYDGEIVFVNRLRTPQTGDSALTMPMILVLAAVVMLMLAKVQKKKNAA